MKKNCWKIWYRKLFNDSINFNNLIDFRTRNRIASIIKKNFIFVDLFSKNVVFQKKFSHSLFQLITQNNNIKIIIINIADLRAIALITNIINIFFVFDNIIDLNNIRIFKRIFTFQTKRKIDIAWKQHCRQFIVTRRFNSKKFSFFNFFKN